MNVTPDYHPRHLSRERWEAMTPARQEEEALAERLLERDVLACQSALIDDLLKTSGDGAQHLAGFETDDIENLYPDPGDWTAKQCHDWLCERGAEFPATASNPWVLNREELTEELAALGIQAYDHEDDETLRAALFDSIDAGDWGDVEDWREAVTDADPEPAEPLEWWLVSGDLARDLAEIGEPIIDNGYGTWWGRTCSGQSIMLDGTLQAAAALIINRANEARESLRDHARGG